MLLQATEPPERLGAYLSDLVAICGARPESVAVLMSLLEYANDDLKYMAIFQLGELWLAGASVSSNLINLLPALAQTKDRHIVNAIIHAIEKLIAVRRYGQTAEDVPRALIECLEYITGLADDIYFQPRRAARALAVVRGKPMPLYYEGSL